MIQNVLVVTPGQYTHSQAFLDVAYAFSETLTDLGHYNQITTNPDYCEDGTTLIFGAHLIPKFDGSIEGDYVIYQTEQLTASNSLFVDSKYIELLKKFPVWDYSQSNIDYLKTLGINAQYVPIGYHRSMANLKTGRSVSIAGGGKSGKQRVSVEPWSGTFPNTDVTGRFVQDIDICFYGSINQRRQKIIDGLKTITFPAPDGEGGMFDKPITVANFIGYGSFRDKVIARSKIVLNVHYYDSAIFEMFRCAHAFANRRLVVSEKGNDKCLEVPYYETKTFVEYEEIVETCRHFLANDVKRGEATRLQNDIFKQTRLFDSVKHAIG